MATIKIRLHTCGKHSGTLTRADKNTIVIQVWDAGNFGLEGGCFSAWCVFGKEGRMECTYGIYYDIMMLYAAGDMIDAQAVSRYLEENV